MIRTNFLTLLVVTGAIWLALSAFLAYDCGGQSQSLWFSAVSGLQNSASAGLSNGIQACELTRVKAVVGETGVRIWTSLPTGLVALILLQLLRRHLASNAH